MKQITAILYLAVLTAMVSACSEDELADNTQPSGKVPMEFYANTDASTRTELTTENAVYWETNDAISLFNPTGTNNQFSTTQSGPSVTFTGEATPAKGTYYALYPYDANAQIEGTIITTTLPAEQDAREGSFAQGLNPSVATADATNSLYFKNVCALVKFTLAERATTTITKATLCGNNSEALAGTLTIDAAASTPIAMADTSFGQTVIELNGSLTPGSTYYFVTAPASLSNGLTLSLYDDKGNVWKKEGTQPAILTASRILNLGTVKPDNFIPAKGYEEINGICHIYNADGLKVWAANADVLNKNVILEKDIDLTGVEWTPVGSDMNTGYAGEFNGNGKFIYNLTINSTENNVGFFGGLAGGTVHDVKFANAQVTANSGGAYAGVIAGSSMGKIESCNVRSSQVTGHYAGAIVGNNSVQVNRCNALDIEVSATHAAGGIAGASYGKTEYCSVSGNSHITTTGSSTRAGGIIGTSSQEGGVSTSGRLLKCAVDGATISGTWAGGIAGENSFGIVAQCIANRVTVTHNSSEASTRLGGVVGYNTRGDVVASYAAYSTIGRQDLTSEAMGGIVGYNYNGAASVYGCYATHVSLMGTTQGNESGVGSIAGYTSGHIISCYAILPDNAKDISLVGKYTSYAPEHCVEAGNTDYATLTTNVPNLIADDKSVWEAAKIWDLTASGSPAIVSTYICNPPANQP
ncbi:fimbrillin family protein [Mediterranea massiliensis]|uniref:fimbrillin family protein n=1 Tax=Mediterranea massiliensis TaxID=1841865 RepID=UPI0025A3A0B1|nr:fimbrillin family protein [Mediterranea massiliensis]MDM8337317.1 fimbrillin family protein [Mediterranea massiliensis]